MVSSLNQDGSLNESQQRRLLVSCTYIDKLLRDVEEVLNESASKSPFPKYISDISPTQRRVIEDYLARLRSQLIRILEGMHIPLPVPEISAVHSLKTAITFIAIAVEELKPRYMRGYGEVQPSAQEALNGIVAELDGLLHQLNTYLGAEMGLDFEQRLRFLEALGAVDVQGLRTVEEIIAKYGLVEFRPTLNAIMDSLEDQTFEIAVFGRVSCGKSTLLNRILDTDLLPVGVTPITAVPTRIRVGSIPQLSVTFAGFGTKLFDVSQISEFATEQGNPANGKRVAKLVLTLPSPNLRKGITFVDTPGLGSLATAGAAETMAYLPRCDFAIVLVDAGTALSADDLRLLRTLYQIGIPNSVLLSKSDLVDESQRNQLVRYIEDHLSAELGDSISVHPVSAAPVSRDLLDHWYRAHLIPLLDDAKHLRVQSGARKIGSMRAALDAALRTLRKSEVRREATEIVQEEDSLRRFSGRFVQLKKDVHSVIDRTVNSLDVIIEEAVSRAWPFRKDLDFAEKIRAEIDSLTNDFGTVIFNHIQQFLPQMIVQLQHTAEAVSSPSKPGDQEFAAIAREIPRFEAPALPAAEIKVSALATALGAGFAQGAVARQVKNSIGRKLSDNLSYYRTMLRNWAEPTITQLQSAFDAFAELYRGGMRRQLDTNGHSASAEEIDADLKKLEELTVTSV